MNTANKLTLMRVFLIPLFLIVLYLDFPFHMWVALAIFILASVTDFLDGYIARHYNQVTDFGKFMDPLCWFVASARMPAWALVVVLFREFAVTALRLIAAERGRVIAAAWSGKVKTASSMVCICLMLFVHSCLLDDICVAVILVTTIYSGIEYFLKNRDVMDWKDM